MSSTQPISNYTDVLVFSRSLLSVLPKTTCEGCSQNWHKYPLGSVYFPHARYRNEREICRRAKWRFWMNTIKALYTPFPKQQRVDILCRASRIYPSRDSYSVEEAHLLKCVFKYCKFYSIYLMYIAGYFCRKNVANLCFSFPINLLTHINLLPYRKVSLPDWQPLDYYQTVTVLLEQQNTASTFI